MKMTIIWRNYKVHNFSPFEVGKGYLHAVETAATKEFYGDFNVRQCDHY